MSQTTEQGPAPLRVLEQTDVALGCAGLDAGNILRTELLTARNAFAELVEAVLPHVAMTYAEARDASLRGAGLIYCNADKLNPCWSEGTPYTGKHWGWTPDADGDWHVCPSCRLRAAIAAVVERAA